MKSVLVIGLGRFGRHLAVRMQELGNDVMIVDKDPELVELMANQFTECSIGDCTKEPVIASLGVENFDLCFVTTGDDFQSSLVTTALLKRHGAKRVISKTTQDIQEMLLKQIGATEVVYPEREIAERVAVRYNSDNIFDFIPLTEDVAIYEINTPRAWVGNTIVGVDVRKKHNVNIIAIKKGEKIVAAPGPGYIFCEGDHIMVMGASSDVFKLAGKA